MVSDPNWKINAVYKVSVTNASATLTKRSPQVQAYLVTNKSAIKVHIAVIGTPNVSGTPVTAASATGVDCITLRGAEDESVTIPVNNVSIAMIRDTAESSNATVEVWELS